jgi:eukaryotic-like serine/threonine-protein kinase
MATVYRARDLRLGREVAVKIIHRHLRDNPEVASRFVAEARAAASLKHRGIVEVYDVSDEGDRERYLVVELVRGQTLRQLLVERRDMPAEVGASIVLELCDALQHAHESGIVHRDVKPENVLIALQKPSDGDPGGVRRSTRGRDSVRETWERVQRAAPNSSSASSSERRSRAAKARALAPSEGALILKLTDFGIAKLLDAQGVTSTGQVLGSPAHMAPEQIEGREIDARTDVFALGVVLYECLAGHLPFEGKNPAQVLRRVLEGDFAPSRCRSTCRGGPLRALRRRGARHRAVAAPRERTSARRDGCVRSCRLSVSRTRVRRWWPIWTIPRPTPSRCQPVSCRGCSNVARRPGGAGMSSAQPPTSTAPTRSRRTTWPCSSASRSSARGAIETSCCAGPSVGAIIIGVLGLVGAGMVGHAVSPARLARSEISTDGTPLLPERYADLGPEFRSRQPLVSNPRSTSVASALRAPPLRRSLRLLRRSPRTEERALRGSPRGAHLEVDGARIDHFGGTLTLSPGVHEAKLSPPPGDPCCDAVSTSFRVLPAPENEPGQVQSVPLSLRFRPATVRIANGPVGGMVTCGAFLSMGVGATREVTMTTAVWEGYCTFIGEGRSEQAFRTIRAGVSNALAWPNPS